MLVSVCVLLRVVLVYVVFARLFFSLKRCRESTNAVARLFRLGHRSFEVVSDAERPRWNPMGKDSHASPDDLGDSRIRFYHPRIYHPADYIGNIGALRAEQIALIAGVAAGETLCLAATATPVGKHE